ncbi:MAG: ABC transporter permease subunit, partial [Thermoplasmata archaeon]
PIAAALSYYVGLAAGWSRRPEYDTPSRLVTLGTGLIPVFLIGLLVIFTLFYSFFSTFHDIPGDGIIPSPSWFMLEYPSWITNGWITHPTGLPMIDGIIHTDWPFEAITLAKTLMQGIIVAIVYVAVFLRHARNVVASASQEASVTAARSRGISERVLLWRHTAARVRPTFLILFALTIPAYLATQFVVESVFTDPGIGYLTLTVMTAPLGSENLAGLEGMMLLLAILIVVWAFVVDLLAIKSDPRGVTAR